MPATTELNSPESQPFVTAAVEPQNVELAEVSCQLGDLPTILLPKCYRVIHIQIGEEETGEAPIQRRVVETDAESSIAHRLHIVRNEVVMCGGLRCREVAARVIEQSEAVVMPRRQDHVLHAGV